MKTVKRWRWITAVALVAYVLAASAGMVSGGVAPNVEQHARTLGLKAPVKVEAINEYSDGGTVTFTFADAKARKAVFGFDHSLASRTRGRLYSGALHPRNPGAKTVPLGGATEKAVLGILQAFLDSRFSRSDQKVLSGMTGGDVRLRYGDKGAESWLLLRGFKRLQEVKARQTRPTRRPKGRP
jgi:hypothetical protein